MNQLNDGTAASLIAFLDNLAQKGRATHDTVSALKIATSKVLSVVEGDSWKQVDVTKLDLKDAMNVFKVKTAGTYNDASLYTYSTRLKRSLAWYSEFLKNPGFTPPLPKTRSPRTPKPAPNEVGIKSDPDYPDASKPLDSAAGQNSTPPQAGLLPYMFNLRRDTVITMYLPADINTVDVARLTKFIDSLVFEEE